MYQRSNQRAKQKHLQQTHTQKLIVEVAKIILFMIYYCGSFSYVWYDVATHPRYQSKQQQHSDPEANTEEVRYQVIVALIRVCTNGRLRRSIIGHFYSRLCLPVMSLQIN